MNNQNDSFIVEEMIEIVEQIIREKVRDDYNVAKATSRKAVSKEILKKLDEVVGREDKKD